MGEIGEISQDIDEDSQCEKVSRRRKSQCPHEIWTKLVIRQVPNVPKAIQDFNEGFQEVKVKVGF